MCLTCELKAWVAYYANILLLLHTVRPNLWNVHYDKEVEVSFYAVICTKNHFRHIPEEKKYIHFIDSTNEIIYFKKYVIIEIERLKVK